jgi:hypothetical protein
LLLFAWVGVKLVSGRAFIDVRSEKPGVLESGTYSVLQ